MSVNKLKKTLKSFSKKDSNFAKFLKEDTSDEDLMNNNKADEDDDDDAMDDDLDEDMDDEIDLDLSSDPEVESNKKELSVASDDEYSDVIDTDSDSTPGVELGKNKQTSSSLKNQTITIKMINKCRNKLQMNCVESLKFLTLSFKAAINFADDTKDDCQFVVNGGTVYNAIISTCLVDLIPSLQNILSDSVDIQSNKNSKSNGESGKTRSNLNSQLEENKFISSKNWKAVKTSLKSYILDVLRLLGIVGKDELLIDLMKHFLDLSFYISAYPKFHKPAIKKCIDLWSASKDEPIRIVAFRCILYFMPHLSQKVTEFVLSKMYISFVRNCRFTSVNTLAEISYMKRSLVELLATKPDLAYRSSFLNIRQMARLLHNALKLQKKEVKQSICSWQFVHPLCLYCILVGRLHGDEYIKSLAHPIVEIILGTIRLNESGSYYPLRITLVRNLIQLMQSSNIYIPLAPLILEILDFPALLKNPKQSSIKSLNMDCILRASKVELKEKAFSMGLLDAVFELTLSFLSSQSSSIAFPEICLPFIVQLKKFLKQCKVGTYTRKMKVLLSKIEENIKFVEKIRTNSLLNLADGNSVNLVENKLAEEIPPIKKFYDNWIKVSIKNKELTLNPKQKDEDGLPKVIQPTKRPKATEEERKEFKGLFMDESEDESRTSEQSDHQRFEVSIDKDKRLKKSLKNKSGVNDAKKRKSDVVQEVKLESKKTKKAKINNEHLDFSDNDIPDTVQDFDLSDI